MRFRTWMGLGIAGLTALGVAAPAVADVGTPAACRQIRGADTPSDTADDVSVCREDVWLHKADTPLGNLSGTQADSSPSWSTTQPVAFPVGGAAYLPVAPYDIFVSQDPTGRAIFKGTFTGDIDTLGFQVYLHSPVWEATGDDWGATAYLAIDGAVIHDNFDSGAIGIPMQTAGNFRRIDGVFTNVYQSMIDNGLDLDPAVQHNVEIALVPWSFGDSQSVLFYDSAEVPSGLIFNLEPENMTGFTQIDVTPPSEGSPAPA
jgi:hypothetical protein